jgi:hypothetical protein
MKENQMQWFRIWHDMLNDPKWRVVARKSNTRVCEVISVALAVLNSASQHDERGAFTTNHEDIAAALDMDEEVVSSIIAAMEGRFIESGKVINWEKRQPKREDDSSERTKAWRERKKQNGDAPVTQCDAPDSDSEKIKTPLPPKKGEEVLKSGRGSFSVVPLLAEWAIDAAKANAPNWDIYHLASIYNENVRSGKMDMPRDANKAFPAWVRCYTKDGSIRP